MKTSSVPDAGRGLFSLTSRRIGDHLVDYFGDVLEADDIEARYPAKNTGVYTLALSKTLFIDSALVRGVGASANAPPPNVRANVRFVVNPRLRSARLEVSRRIEAGEEVFVSYGTEYWKHAQSTFHETSDVPDWEWDLSDPFAPASALLVPVPALVPVCPAPALLVPVSCAVPAPAPLVSVSSDLPPSAQELSSSPAPQLVRASSVPLLQLDCDPELWLGD